jgi:hypothetical protein
MSIDSIQLKDGTTIGHMREHLSMFTTYDLFRHVENLLQILEEQDKESTELHDTIDDAYKTGYRMGYDEGERQGMLDTIDDMK